MARGDGSRRGSSPPFAENGGEPPPRSRLIVFYIVLAALTAIVVTSVISKGKGETAQPPIAGGYDAIGMNPCLGKPSTPPPGRPLPPTAPVQPQPAGPSFDVKQSGRFVNFSNVQGTFTGKLKLEGENKAGPHRLHGDVHCVNGDSATFEGTASPGQKGRIAGTLAGRALTADLKRDPPDPGASKPRVPGSIDGPYRTSPRSTCLGGDFDLEEPDPCTGYERKSRTSASSPTRPRRERSPVTCTAPAAGGRGSGRSLSTATSTTFRLTPLDPAKPVGVDRAGKPSLSTPSGLAPAGRNSPRPSSAKSSGCPRRFLHRGRRGHARRAAVRHRSRSGSGSRG